MRFSPKQGISPCNRTDHHYNYAVCWLRRRGGQSYRFHKLLVVKSYSHQAPGTSPTIKKQKFRMSIHKWARTFRRIRVHTQPGSSVFLVKVFHVRKISFCYTTLKFGSSNQGFSENKSNLPLPKRLKLLTQLHRVTSLKTTSLKIIEISSEMMALREVMTEYRLDCLLDNAIAAPGTSNIIIIIR
jgi:hypothetical protein